MNNQTDRINYLPLFEQDLNEIVDYITVDLQNPGAAHKLVDKVEEAIYKRLDNPLMYAPHTSSKTRKHPYYKINVGNYSIFYVVIDDVMEVRRILYSRRNIDELI